MRKQSISANCRACCCLIGLAVFIGFLWRVPFPLAAAQTCSFTITPGSQNFSSGGGGGSVTVAASQPACTWMAASNASWLTITAGTNGTGIGTVGYTVAANPTAAQRTGTLTIAGQTFTVMQAAGLSGLMFFPLAHPVRLLDTRPGELGCDAPGQPIPGNTSRTQTASRTCGGLTIPANAMAVTGNITTVQSGGGFLTLYPSDAQQPTVANSNYNPNEILNNVFTVGLGNADGAFKIFVTSTTHVVVDVTGYYAPPGAGGLYFHSLPKPIRLLETRTGFTGCNTPSLPLPGNLDTTQQARLSCDGVTIPTSARAVVGNATTVNPGGGFLTLFPADAARPLVASSNYLPGQVMNAPFTVGLSVTGEFKIYPTTQTDLVIDVLGYYSPELVDLNGAGLLFNPLPHPVRLLETRNNPNFQGCFKPNAPLQGGVERTQAGRGMCDGVTIASDALALVGNATVVNSNGGFMTFWPSDVTKPLVATSNFTPGQVFNRHFTVGLSQVAGAFNIFSPLTTDLVIDLSGYYAPLPANQAPTVNAGADQTIALASAASLAGNVSDDGLPIGGTLTLSWSKVSGPGNVNFGNASQVTTTASFSATGVYVLRLTANDSQLTASDEVTITVNPPLLVNAGVDQVITLPNTAMLVGTVTGGSGSASSAWSKVSGPDAVLFSNASAAMTTAIFPANGVYVLRLTATDFDTIVSDDMQVMVNADPTTPPPDPATVAPPVDPTVVTTIGTGTQFLYTGPNPIQTGVAAGTINPVRAAVLRGRVKSASGAPLPLAKISILGHPEFGQTLSRADGKFDLAVNGGGWLTVNYEKLGFLPVQRQMEVPWQDYRLYPDVIMLGYDPQVTLIDLGANIPVQVARGTTATDTSGNRRATLLFQQGTTVMMKLPGGAMQGLTTLHVRATEYTVGPNGPQAMPGKLPPTSAYTYAVEYSVDEAVAAGARTVLFSQPVISYLEGFLDFPVGSIVPAGAYEREQAAWMPSANGRVIRVLSIAAGAAELDTNGDGLVDNGLSLGVTLAERQRLAELYSAGQRLWRVPITHFTPVDMNFPYGPPPPPPAPPPPPPPPPVPPPPDDPCKQGGSIIECQGQILGEEVPLVGTPFSLNYRSNRKSNYSLDIPLGGATIPANVLGIKLEISVAGRQFTQSFPAVPGQRASFTWDGQDAYNRVLVGAQPATVRIGYSFRAIRYREPADIDPSFADYGNAPYGFDGEREEFTLWQQTITKLGGLDVRAQALGGWTLSPHHAYDPISQALHMGDGSRRSAAGLRPIIDTVAGGGPFGCQPTQACGDGGLASGATIDPRDIAMDGAGNLFIADTHRDKIRKVDPGGIITTVAGTGVAGSSGDGGPATQARLNSPWGVAVDAQGNLFIADQQNHRIRKVDTAGIITTVAGNGTPGLSGDGGPATQAQLNFPQDVAVAPDGTLFIADFSNHRIRRVSPNGIMSTASRSTIVNASSVLLDNEGNLFFHGSTAVYRLSPDGEQTIFAGGGSNDSDGIPATESAVAADGMGVDRQGKLYLGDFRTKRLRVVDKQGIISSVAGGGANNEANTKDGLPATSAVMSPKDTLEDGQGNLLVLDRLTDLGVSLNRVRRIRSVLPQFAGPITIASEDGSQLYNFSAFGRHLSTINALTGATIYSFAYDSPGSAGRLVTITDGDNNVTTIERNANGQPTAIVAPFGPRTTLSLNANGYLASIANPAGETTQCGYTNDGLMTSFTDPRGNVSQMTYDAQGRLTRDNNPAGGFFALSRTETPNSFMVSLTSALNRVTSYVVERLATGEERRVNTFPNGLQTQQTKGANGKLVVASPDGTTTMQLSGPDPRWGMQSPLNASRSISTPGGLSSTSMQTRAVTLSNPNDPSSLLTLTDTFTLNGRVATSVYTAASRTLTSTSAAGRQSSMLLDNQGRILSRQIPGFAARQYTYDNRGRPTTATEGSGVDARSITFAYNAQGFLSSITDPLQRVATFERNLQGRVTRKTLPDGRQIQYTYDANGNLTSITPPARPAHAFTFTVLDLLASYLAPNIGLGSNLTHFAYDLDRKLDLITRPDGTTVDYSYDAAGRLNAIVISQGQVNFSYHPATGNLATITAPGGGALSYSYDGNLLTNTAWSGTVVGSVGRVYDNDFRVVSQSVNGGNTINFGYDNDGLLTGAGGLTLTRNAQNGLVTGTALGPLTDTWSYNGFGEPTAYSAARSGAGLYAVQYTRDKLGRITQKMETIGGATDNYAYTYDLVGRLTTVQKNGAAIATYAYDNNSNRLSYTGPGGAVNGAYDNQDRLTQYGASVYSYTANGERLTKIAGGQTTTYQYDALSNLLRVVLPDTTQIDYVVDGLNRRIGKKVNGTLAQGFLYQGGLNPVAELDGNNNVVSRFIYGARANVPEYMVKGGATYRLISDQLGSPRLVVNVATGAVAQRLDYDEFGVSLLDTNPGFQPFGFAGGLYDTQTKLVRFGARDYDAETGRWTTKDPILFAGGDTNLYGYVLNDPVNLIDPTGTQGTPLVDALKEADSRYKHMFADPARAQHFEEGLRDRGYSNPNQLLDDWLFGSGIFSEAYPPMFDDDELIDPKEYGDSIGNSLKDVPPNNPGSGGSGGGSSGGGSGGGSGAGAGDSCKPKPEKPRCTDCLDMIKQYGRIVAPCQVWPPCA